MYIAGNLGGANEATIEIVKPAAKWRKPFLDE